MFWQSAGDYLCVKVERYKKTNVVNNETRYSGIYYNFEFFRMREKQIPVESVEVKENVYSFAWEPNGARFAIISGEQTSKTTGSFYKIVSPTQNVAGKIELIKEFKNRGCLQVSWSPQGQYCALVTTVSKSANNQPVAATSCHAEFYEVQASDVQFFTKVEHEHMSDYEWDPTGRYFVSYVSFLNHRVSPTIYSNCQLCTSDT